MSRSLLNYLQLLVLLAALLLCIGPAISAPSYGEGKDRDDKEEKKGTIRVKEQDSIQEAIDKAKKGTRIEVYGKHVEQIEITKDDISLIGRNAILVAPASDKYKVNKCTGLSKEFIEPGKDGKDTNAGICIYGKVKLNETYTQFEGHKKVLQVHDPVKNVQVSGFDIIGFDGQNIAVYGGKNVRIFHNKLKQGGRYGLLTAGSRETEASDNLVVGSSPISLNNGAIAMCMDDFSPAVFSKNDISNYYIGLCTETNGGLNKGNEVHECCLGNVIDPGVKDVKTTDNHFFDHNLKCPAGSAAGITMLGSIDALVNNNRIDNIVTGDQLASGLFIADILGVATGNKVVKNIFGVNEFDIFADTVGRNEIRNNECDNALKNTTSGPLPAPEFCN